MYNVSILSKIKQRLRTDNGSAHDNIDNMGDGNDYSYYGSHYYSDVTWALWRLKLRQLDCWINCMLWWHKKEYQISVSLILCEGHPPGTGRFLHKGPVIRKVCSCPNAIMIKNYPSANLKAIAISFLSSISWKHFMLVKFEMLIKHCSKGIHIHKLPHTSPGVPGF